MCGMGRRGWLPSCILCLALLLACDSVSRSPTSPDLALSVCGGACVGVAGVVISGCTFRSPQPHWRDIYTELEECSGMTGIPYDNISWYGATSIFSTDLDAEASGVACGVPGSGTCSIVFDESRGALEDTIRHELLHVVLKASGILDHDPQYAHCAPNWKDSFD